MNGRETGKQTWAGRMMEVVKRQDRIFKWMLIHKLLLLLLLLLL
jgi:hypothetical protein